MVRAVPRAEPVGSPIRPADITGRLDEIYAANASASPRFTAPEKAVAFGDLARACDGYVAEFVRRQVEAGLDVVTDGEIRRSHFMSSLFDAATGFTEPAERLSVTGPGGEVIYSGFADPSVGGPLRKASNPAVGEAAVLRGLSGRPVPFKITFPAPSYFLAAIVEVEPDAGYRTRRALLDDVIAVEQELVTESIAAGAPWIQFDFPIYSGLADTGHAAQLAGLHGMSPEDLLSLAIEADSKVAAGIPAGVTVAMHLCRGNFPGGMWNGSLEPVAEQMFGGLPFRRYLIKWEDVEREGDYSPLRHVPRDVIVGLGLVSTKTPVVESDDDVLRRLDEAARFLPLEQLALSPQCGFASLMGDRLVKGEDAQWRKLDLVGRVADRVWGTA